MRKDGPRRVGLCGNPNVGKSTLFNRLTGLRQHTGNWPGKTVGSAEGRFERAGTEFLLTDTPGSYSLCARSAEEAAARDYILFGGAQLLCVVCDATALRRSLTLALQIRELRGDVVVCVNLLDEAAKKGVAVDTAALAAGLGVPVLGVSAASGAGVEELVGALARDVAAAPWALALPPEVETALAPLAAYLAGLPLPAPWLARTLARGEEELCAALQARLCLDPARDAHLAALIENARAALAAAGGAAALDDLAAAALDTRARELCEGAVTCRPTPRQARDRRLDKILTHRVWGLPAMAALLALVLWITVSAANVPSELLSRALLGLGERLRDALCAWGLPGWFTGALCDGVWRTTAWVTAVMLPPMAIFFPLFTLLEDLGYLPRLAFNLDGAFRRCGACGKQGLCMCMGLGCNAVGVTGCRIIDSPRERLLAQLTNSFMPCNGRFPTLIALLTVFFAPRGGGALAALLLCAALLLAFGMTLLVCRILSATLLRGTPSAFTLELPPYRVPRVGEVVVRSILDRTLFVLGRALGVAAPAGLVIWLLGNFAPGGVTLLSRLAAALDGAGRFLGLDGAILLGFILALPANEIALPAMLLCYASSGALEGYGTLAELSALLAANGWSARTALCAVLFTLFHWPCAATLLTLRRETGRVSYTLLAAALPTACGAALCAAVNALL